jgi:protoporphyrin/coproporphyrin ferrochelatase
MTYDAILLVSFGGPEGPDDVLPFLRNVVRGRGVPDQRLAEVAEHYHHFGGVSPINAQCRELLAALRPALDAAGITLPLYWGNRNWTPYLTQTVAQMRVDGVHRALAFVTSPFGSFSSCRQYLDDIDAARAARAEPGPAPVIDKIRHYHDHPGYVQPHADAVRAAVARLSAVDDLGGAERALPAMDAVPHPGGGTDSGPRLVFTAHSIPTGMAACAGPTGGRYQAQLAETARLVAERAGYQSWDLVWQSRSGPPRVPWLVPDINEHLVALAGSGVAAVVVSPIGFGSDHLEVRWDLDTEAAQTAAGLGLRFARAATPGADPRFVAMVVDLVSERLSGSGPRARLGALPVWDECPADCCRTPLA